MLGEYTRAGRTHHFTLESPPPSFITLVTRECFRSPRIEIDLEYTLTDPVRDVACYRIVEERPA